MNGVSQITAAEDVALVTLYKVPSKIEYTAQLFGYLAERRINVDMISQTAPRGTEVDLSFTVSDDQVVEVLELSNLVREKTPSVQTSVSSSNVKLTISGEEMPDTYGVAARVFETLCGAGVELLLVTTSEVDISVLVSSGDYPAAEEALRKAFAV